MTITPELDLNVSKETKRRKNIFYKRKKGERKMLLTKNMSKMFTLNGNPTGS